MDLFDRREVVKARVAKPMRPHQDRLVADIRASLARGNRRVLAQAPTGSGKTRCMAEIGVLAKRKNRDSMFLAPRRELVYQIRDALANEGMRVGVIMAGERPPLYETSFVASFDTVASRAMKRETMELPKIDLLITDEAHMATSDGRQEILAAYPDIPHVLFTATPAGPDGKSLSCIADDLVLGPSIHELVDEGFLLPLRYFAPSEPDLRKLKLDKDGDYKESGLARTMDTPKLIGDIVDNWERIARGRSTVVFAVNRKHSRHLVEEFQARGVTAEHLDGDTPKEERKAILARVESGETQVLCNVFVATYGLDIPRLSCAVLARPTKNLVLYLQMLGRVMRPFGDQVDGIVIDHAGAVRENGFADEDHPWSLADDDTTIKQRMKDQKIQDAAPKELVCQQCKTVFVARAACPSCGHQVVSPTAKLPVYEADLQEIERPKGKETAAEKRNRTTPDAQKAQFYGELRLHAQKKGLSEGWASNVYREAFSVWPNQHKGTPVASSISEQTRKYITSRNIRFANRRSA